MCAPQSDSRKGLSKRSCEGRTCASAQRPGSWSTAAPAAPTCTPGTPACPASGMQRQGLVAGLPCDFHWQDTLWVPHKRNVVPIRSNCRYAATADIGARSAHERCNLVDLQWSLAAPTRAVPDAGCRRLHSRPRSGMPACSGVRTSCGKSAAPAGELRPARGTRPDWASLGRTRLSAHLVARGKAPGGDGAPVVAHQDELTVPQGLHQLPQVLECRRSTGLQSCGSVCRRTPIKPCIRASCLIRGQRHVGQSSRPVVLSGYRTGVVAGD